jgi:hypothetical protein
MDSPTSKLINRVTEYGYGKETAWPRDMPSVTVCDSLIGLLILQCQFGRPSELQLPGTRPVGLAGTVNGRQP